MAQQVVEVRQAGARPLRVLLDDHLEIGRECDGLLVADGEVSRRHCRLEVVGGQVQVSDLGSSNGTFVNGGRIAAPTTIGSEDTVRIGSTDLRLQALAVAEPVTASVRGAPAPGTVTPSATGDETGPGPGTTATGRVHPAAPAGDGDDPRATSILRVAASVQEERPLITNPPAGTR
jgi:pSer/pThr/pTyr-binding forkhead associated (FHA) protein